ncbi:MAG: hypothetical protein FD161_1017 [Limisphaerales bacterium]|nr:MAG: hypothetical protein FD161_1017 [Limisphaerales bacterium]KAG0509800.1 MAG: hypothetical protein E1N63_1017 [Limisphaerales bacterium]
MSALQAAQVGHLRSGSRIARRLAAIGLLGWLLAATDAAAAIRFEADRNNPLAVTLIVEAPANSSWPADAVAELTRAAQPWFGLWLGEGKPGSVPLAGTYSHAGAQLRFRPSLPLLPGQTYTARLDRPGLSLRAEHRTAAPAPAAAPKLLAIYPTSDRLPANHLKFYLVFSEPMESGVFLQHCRLVNARGQAVEAPFRETELWSPDGRRLTLWFHPGRQKTGVNLNVEFGPVLREGGDYRLVIDGRWPSARGVPLGANMTKSFRARSWQVHAPAAGTRDVLRVTFPQPLDWATLHRLLHVTGKSGEIAGAITVTRGEQEWQFVPEKPWAAGPHELRIATAIEDHAGNSLARPFEVNLQRLVNRPLPAAEAETKLPFVVR